MHEEDDLKPSPNHEGPRETRLSSKCLARLTESEEVNMKNVLLFLVTGLLLIAASKVFGQETQAPVYKEGDCWVFRSVSKNFQGLEDLLLADVGFIGLSRRFRPIAYQHGLTLAGFSKALHQKSETPLDLRFGIP